jgi:hypothetical protein
MRRDQRDSRDQPRLEPTPEAHGPRRRLHLGDAEDVVNRGGSFRTQLQRCRIAAGRQLVRLCRFLDAIVEERRRLLQAQDVGMARVPGRVVAPSVAEPEDGVTERLEVLEGEPDVTLCRKDDRRPTEPERRISDHHYEVFKAPPSRISSQVGGRAGDRRNGREACERRVGLQRAIAERLGLLQRLDERLRVDERSDRHQAPRIRKAEYRVMSRTHRSGHSADRVTLINHRMAVDESDRLVDRPFANPGLQRQSDRRLGLGRLLIGQCPVGVGRLAVDRMLFFAEFCSISAERQAEKIAAERANDRRRFAVEFLRVPRGDVHRVDRPPTQLEPDRRDLPAGPRDRRFDRLALDRPRRLVQHID